MRCDGMRLGLKWNGYSWRQYVRPEYHHFTLLLPFPSLISPSLSLLRSLFLSLLLPLFLLPTIMSLYGLLWQIWIIMFSRVLLVFFFFFCFQQPFILVKLNRSNFGIMSGFCWGVLFVCVFLAHHTNINAKWVHSKSHVRHMFEIAYE